MFVFIKNKIISFNMEREHLRLEFLVYSMKHMQLLILSSSTTTQIGSALADFYIERDPTHKKNMWSVCLVNT